MNQPGASQALSPYQTLIGGNIKVGSKFFSGDNSPIGSYVFSYLPSHVPQSRIS